MSHLSLFDPHQATDEDAPRILKFSAELRGPRMQDVIARARLSRRNRQCPSCQRVTVDPIELGDAWTNRNGASVSGSATVVGFRCNSCRHQWGVRERA